ncbi:MAG TPA: hypothetical protein DEB36_02835, partial [Porphyromonadaceae bacterium]|nr:hypothetical protein [Porphyromonadaceae bacterium]
MRDSSSFAQSVGFTFPGLSASCAFPFGSISTDWLMTTGGFGFRMPISMVSDTDSPPPDALILTCSAPVLFPA